MRRQLLIPQVKVSTTLKFKRPTFIFPPPNPQRIIIFLLLQANPKLSYFFPIKNLFSLSKETPFGLEKGNIFSLPSASSSFSIYIAATVAFCRHIRSSCCHWRSLCCCRRSSCCCQRRSSCYRRQWSFLITVKFYCCLCLKDCRHALL